MNTASAEFRKLIMAIERLGAKLLGNQAWFSMQDRILFEGNVDIPDNPNVAKTLHSWCNKCRKIQDGTANTPSMIPSASSTMGVVSDFSATLVSSSSGVGLLEPPRKTSSAFM